MSRSTFKNIITSHLPGWHDISSYSRGDHDRTPRSFEMRIGSIRLVVTRKLHLEGWYIDAPPFIISRRTEAEDIEQAKQEALTALEHELERALFRLRNADGYSSPIL